MSYITNITPQSYLAGQIVDSNPYSLKGLPVTGSNAIPFGIAMKIDGATQGYQLPSASGDITNRMAVCTIINRNQFYSYNASLQPIIGDNTSVPVGVVAEGVTSGMVAVVVEEAVQAGDICYIRYAANGLNTQLGSFRKSADTSTAAAHPTWYYESSATSGSKAIVRVN